MDDVEFVYFDLDDTLLDHQHAERKALADVRDRYLTLFGALSVDELQEEYHAINAPLWERYADGEIDKETLQEQRFEQLVEAVGGPHANAALIGRYYIQRYAEHWQFIPGAREAFEAVAEQVPVGVLTNGFVEVQKKKFDRFPILREMAAAIVICEEAGVLKPDPEIFAHAAEKVGVPAEKILYVGDSYRSDVQGAQGGGWHVAWYACNGTNGQSTDGCRLVFDEWADLLDHLQ